MFWIVQTLDGHGHFYGYDDLLFNRLKNLIDIKGWIRDYVFCSFKINEIVPWDHRYFLPATVVLFVEITSGEVSWSL